MDSTFFHLVASYQWLAYVLLFFGVLFEGETLIFTAFFLVHRGALHWLPVVGIVFPGVLIGDLLWYTLGFYFDRMLPKTKRWVQRAVGAVDRRLGKQPGKTIFISKFIYGTHRISLVVAGASKIPIGKFLTADIPASILWIILVGGLGYVSAASLHIVHRYIRYSELGLLLAVVSLLSVHRLISRWSKKNVS